jgi:hypothetical protein
VSDKSKRRWLQFSLKTLLVVMALAGMIFGRVAYLRHLAEFHRQEAERWSLQLKGPILRQSGRNNDYPTRVFDYHAQLWLDYSHAAYRPWLIVSEPPEPSP